MAVKSSVRTAIKCAVGKCTLERRKFLVALIAIFGAFNIFIFGKRHSWWAPRLRLSLAGPFDDEKPVYFGLKTPPDFPIWPFHVQVTDSQTGEIYVRYECLDSNVPTTSAQLQLKIMLKDASGDVYYTAEKFCPTAMLTSAEYKEKYPGSHLMILEESGVRFDVPLQELHRLQAIDFDFRTTASTF